MSRKSVAVEARAHVEDDANFAMPVSKHTGGHSASDARG